MGYDLHAVHALKGREDGTLEPGEWWAQENYLRRSIGGIGPLRSALLEVGAAFDAETFGLVAPCGWTGQQGEGALRFPRPEEYGLARGPAGIEGARLAEYADAEERVLAAHGPSDVPGIPIHKLCDNSGWHVTALECRAAVALIHRWLGGIGLTPDDARTFAGAVDQEESWEQVSGRESVVYEVGDALPFLTACAEHDGFRVY